MQSVQNHRELSDSSISVALQLFRHLSVRFQWSFHKFPIFTWFFPHCLASLAQCRGFSTRSRKIWWWVTIRWNSALKKVLSEHASVLHWCNCEISVRLHREFPGIYCDLPGNRSNLQVRYSPFFPWASSWTIQGHSIFFSSLFFFLFSFAHFSIVDCIIFPSFS